MNNIHLHAIKGDFMVFINIHVTVLEIIFNNFSLANVTSGQFHLVFYENACLWNCFN